MALKSIDQLGAGGSLLPETEASRLAKIARYRQWYEGRFATPTKQASFGGKEDPLLIVRFNWFRRVARFYPEFMLSETPVTVVEERERLTDWIADRADHVWEQLTEANVDAIRYGYGVLVSHPQDPRLPWSVSPTDHFEVHDNLGEVTGDAVLRKRGDLLDVYWYPVDGQAERRIHKLDGIAIGELLKTEVLDPRAGRQAVFFTVTPAMESWYDDISDSIIALTKAVNRLGRAVARNMDPHMYGPANPTGAGGTVFAGLQGVPIYDQAGEPIRGPLSGKGSKYIGVPDGQQAPGFLQWDPKIQAYESIVEAYENDIYRSTGLSRMLFDPEMSSGNVTGVALRRLMMPFVARVMHLRTRNTRAFRSLLQMLVRNNRAAGGELFEWTVRELSIDYRFDDIFQDAVAEEQQETPSD